MSIYIKLDDAIDIVTRIQGMRGDTLNALYDAPRIDLVRCGKCKYKDCCSELGDEIDADDYCSFGERRSDETD